VKMYPVSHLNKSRLSKLRVFFVDLLNRLAIILMENDKPEEKHL
jgi:hypothetical protein